MRESKQRRSAESRRRAVGYLQQLQWLAGFPDEEGTWRTLSGEAIALDGARIARSRRAARAVRREHAAELAELVGDVERWWRIVDAALAWCSAGRGELDLLDHAGPRLARTARELAARQPALRPAIVAAGVAWALAPDELSRVIGWLAAHPDAAAHGVVLALGLARLSLLEGEAGAGAGCGALLALLQLDAPHPYQAVEAVEHLSGWIKEQQGTRKQRGKRRQQPRDEAAAQLAEQQRLARGKTAPVVKRSRPLVRDWLAALLTREPAEQRRALQLLAVAELPAAAQPWIEWEQASAPRLLRATAFAERGFDLRDEQANFERVRDGLAAIVEAAPARCWIPELLDEILQLASKPEAVRNHGSIVRLLAAQPRELGRELPAQITHPPLPPVGPAWRARVLSHLTRESLTAEHARLPWFWDELAAALERGAPVHILAPWHYALADNNWCWFDQEMVELPCKRVEVRRSVEALVELARRGEVTERDASMLRRWLRAGVPVDCALETVARMRDLFMSRTPSEDLMRAAFELVGAAPVELGETVQKLTVVLAGDDHYDERPLTALILRACRAGFSWLMRAALGGDQASRLLAVATSLAALPKTWWPALAAADPSSRPPAAAATSSSRSPSLTPSLSPSPFVDWIARYPAPLILALHRLASVDPDAQSTAARRLADTLPDPADLEREAAALRARAPLAPRLATRLANLEARLAVPPVPSPQRLARLATKLEQAAVAIGLGRLGSLTFAAATARLLRTFGLDEWPAEWPRDRKTVHAVQSLQRLDLADRQLAGRLLLARTGAPPWDLRDEPANRRFLDELRRRGLVLEPWLDDSPKVVDAGGPLELALCSDPLQVFQMGAHFQTCLSPRGMNFFSVVANAADANKRVLYARRGDRVVGRCLLAITMEARLLVFHPYCHESIDFREVVASYARGLAARMGTELASRGAVATLLARDWYDDGAHDLVGRFTALHDIEQLDLSTIEPAALPARLRELLGRPLDELTLPTVLSLRGFQRRPALVLALAQPLLALAAPITRVTAATLALRAGASDLADRLLADHCAAVSLDEHNWLDAEMFARLRPALLLARLRATRARGVRTWREESGVRLSLAGTALEALHRPNQAAAMYQLALDTNVYLRDELRARLRRLEKHRRR
jgi:hypothetical protein